MNTDPSQPVKSVQVELSQNLLLLDNFLRVKGLLDLMITSNVRKDGLLIGIHNNKIACLVSLSQTSPGFYISAIIVF